MAEKVWLFKYSDNYADEFDVNGFVLVSSAALVANFRNMVDMYFDELRSPEFYFGTNEYLEVVDTDEYMRLVTIAEITENEAETLYNLLGGNMYGVTFFDQIIDDNPVYVEVCGKGPIGPLFMPRKRTKS